MYFSYEGLDDKEAGNLFLSAFGKVFKDFLKQNFGEDLSEKNMPDFKAALKLKTCADSMHMAYGDFWEVACLRFGRLEGKNYKTLFDMPDQIKLFVRDSAFDKVIFAESDCKIDYTGDAEQDAYFDWMIKFHEVACEEPVGWLLRKAKLGYIPPAYMEKRMTENATVKALVDKILSDKRAEMVEQEDRQERNKDLHDLDKCLAVIKDIEKELGWSIKHLYLNEEGMSLKKLYRIVDIDVDRDYDTEHAKMYAQCAHMSGKEYGREAIINERNALRRWFEVTPEEMLQRVEILDQFEREGKIPEEPVEEPVEEARAALITDIGDESHTSDPDPETIKRVALIKEEKKKTLVWSGIAEEKDGRGFQTVIHGQAGGKMQRSEPKEIFPKNIGRSNETSPFQQAWLEIRASAQKKVDKGYKPIFNADPDNPFQMPELPHLRPMLAASYKPDMKELDGAETVYLQPKLDGVRCLARVEVDDDGNRHGVLLSREGKRFEVPVDIVREIGEAAWMEPGLVLDGEIYCHGLTFQEIISAVKKKNDNTELLGLHVYDMMFFNNKEFSGKPKKMTFQERVEFVWELPTGPDSKIIKVDTIRFETWDSETISKHHDNCTKAGYEGSILRLPGKNYAPGKRSKNLLKIKVFTDQEFEITGGFSETGKDAGCIVFECRAGNGEVFNVRPKGDVAYRKMLLEILDEHIGNKLTVRFQGLTDSGFPRFPVGIAVRNYE